ncbi:MAG: acyl-CoA dehydrogenase family protein [Gemmatimonadaceae bacterium]|nr:acyl-CoA dehydrogenase family protein [Gemmatimonadaceae bacterium]
MAAPNTCHMDDSLYFTEQHLQVRDMVRAFAHDHIRPVASPHDADPRSPGRTSRRWRTSGCSGSRGRRSWAGRASTSMAFIIAIHELAKVVRQPLASPSRAHDHSGHLADRALRGPSAQKHRYVPLLASGRVMGGFGLTEESAGSDAGGTQTTAVREGRSATSSTGASASSRTAASARSSS